MGSIEEGPEENQAAASGATKEDPAKDTTETNTNGETPNENIKGEPSEESSTEKLNDSKSDGKDSERAPVEGKQLDSETTKESAKADADAKPTAPADEQIEEPAVEKITKTVVEKQEIPTEIKKTVTETPKTEDNVGNESTSDKTSVSEKSETESVKEVSQTQKEKRNSRIYRIVTDKARKDDSGLWRIEVCNNFGKTTATCIVKVLADADLGKEEIPSFLERLVNESSDEGTKVIFRCKSAGVPEPEVKWYKDEIPIDDGLQYRIASYNGRHKLEIQRAHKRDAAIYKCKAINRAGWAMCDAKLYITEPSEDPFVPYMREREFSLAEKIKARRALNAPSDADTLVDDFIDSDILRKFMIKWKSDDDKTLGFDVHLASKCAVEGSMVSLNCLVKGIPPFKVRWYKDDREIYEGSKYFLRNFRGVLCLDVQQSNETDTGNYTCEVRNSQGKIYTSCYLQIEPMLDITNEVPVKPMFVKPMKRLTVNEGELIRFRVTVKGNPAPGFKWFKDAVEIHDSDRITTEVKPNGVAQLIIERATVRDIGLYTCEAHNMAGRARSMVRISVRDKFEIEAWKARGLDGQDVDTNIKTDGLSMSRKGKAGNGDDYTPQYSTGEFSKEPMFTIQLPRSIIIRDRGRFLLECCSAGTPKPIVKWYKDGQELKAGPKVRFLNLGDWYGCEIIDALPGDAGVYTAKIENGGEDMTSSCKVEMQLPVEYERNIPTPIESPQLISREAFLYLAQQTTEDGDPVGLAGIVPSCNLCNTEIDWTATIEKEVEVIDAQEAPNFSTRLPDKITPIANQDSIQLECHVKGEPLPKIGWLKDDQKLTESDHVQITFDDKTGMARLVIDKPEVGDSGKYTCVAYMEHGGHAESITIVEVKASDSEATEIGKGVRSAPKNNGEARSLPEFKVKLHDMDVQLGSDLRLECKVEGSPTPNITWYKNDQSLASNVERCTISSVKGVHTLKINKVKDTDADTYRCEAVNACGAVSSTAMVVVKDIPQVKPERPQFTSPLCGTTAAPGDSVRLQCVLKGVPTPRVTWKKNGVDVTHKYRTEQTDEGEVSLRIKAVTIDDAGLFVCTAENPLGKVETSAALNVVDPTIKQGSGRDAADSTSTQDKMAGAYLGGGDGKIQERSKTGGHGLDLDLSAASSERQPAGFIDYKRRPRFLEHPWSQWVMKNDPLILTFEVLKSDDMAVTWFHNDLAITEGRFKIEVEDV